MYAANTTAPKEDAFLGDNQIMGGEQISEKGSGPRSMPPPPMQLTAGAVMQRKVWGNGAVSQEEVLNALIEGGKNAGRPFTREQLTPVAAWAVGEGRNFELLPQTDRQGFFTQVYGRYESEVGSIGEPAGQEEIESMIPDIPSGDEDPEGEISMEGKEKEKEKEKEDVAEDSETEDVPTFSRSQILNFEIDSLRDQFANLLQGVQNVAVMMETMNEFISAPEDENLMMGASWLMDGVDKNNSLIEEGDPNSYCYALIAGIQDAQRDIMAEGSEEERIEAFGYLKAILAWITGQIQGGDGGDGGGQERDREDNPMISTVSMGSEVSDADKRLAKAKVVSKPGGSVKVSKGLSSALLKLLKSKEWSDFADIEWGLEDPDYDKKIKKLSIFIEEMKRLLEKHASESDWAALDSSGFLYLLNNVGDPRIVAHCHGEKMKMLLFMLQ